MARVLVVDDEADIRMLVQINLELDGHTVVMAGDGREALAAVDAEQPDLILLDVMMPDLDGWAVLEQLKASHAREIKEIPVLMMTALSGDEDQMRGGVEGAVRYLVKPVTPDELKVAVDNALHGDPEPVQRRRAQQSALERIARSERGSSGGAPSGGDQPRPRLSKLEQTRNVAVPRAPRPIDPTLVAGLTTRQHQLLDSVREHETVTAAAAALGMSRSNIYASLRRISRKLDVDTVPDLIERVRRGELGPS